MKIYVAASWKNEAQPAIVTILRDGGYQVFDFKDRRYDEDKYSWDELRVSIGDPWTATEARILMGHEALRPRFERNLDALNWCDVLVALEPYGKSTAIELGYAAGKGKPTAILLRANTEPELMANVAQFAAVNMSELEDWLAAKKQVFG